MDELCNAPEPGEKRDDPMLLNSANALSAIGAPSVPALTPLVSDDSNWWVRATAADVLGDIGKAATTAVSALIQALEDESEWVRRNSVNALGTVGGGVDAVIAALRDSHPLVRCGAVSALVRLCRGGQEQSQAERGLAEVIYEDEYAIVREYAVAALEQLNRDGR